MKMTDATFNTLKTFYRDVINFAGGTLKVQNHYKQHTQTRLVWDVYWAAYGQMGRVISESKNNPNVELTQIQNTLAEIKTLNDSHIETALKKMAKELGLI